MKLSGSEIELLMSVLKKRFTENMNRHPYLVWDEFEKKLFFDPKRLDSIHWMEETGGEPDVVGIDGSVYIVFDCSKETPSGRRNLCYDEEVLFNRKKFPPQDSAMRVASEKEVQIMDEEQYFHLQTLGDFDTKTSSWIKTPPAVRNLGGGLFGDFRFGRTFIYHNGADSYYSSRGFRTVLRV